MIFLAVLLAAPAMAQQGAETIVAGLSQSTISITANFDGSEILIYGAVKRATPIPSGPPLQVIVTVQGPKTPLVVRRKDYRFGIWLNNAEVNIDSAPSFYAVATSGPLSLSLSDTEDLRNKITPARAIRAVGITSEAASSEKFVDALLRIRHEEGRYSVREGIVQLTDQTLFRTDMVLPSALTEGDYLVHIYLTRNGAVIDQMQRNIYVRKEGMERFFFQLAQDQPLLYGLISLLLAAVSGWGASVLFSRWRW